MKSIGLGGLLAAGVLLSPLMLSEAEAYTTFHLNDGNGAKKDLLPEPFNTGFPDLAWSYEFEAHGIGLTVSAASFEGGGTSGAPATLGDPAAVGQYSRGLGVTAHPFENHQVDGWGANDLLIFEFDQTVQMKSVTFSYVDRDDDFTFFLDGTGDGVLELVGIQDISGTGYSTYSFQQEWISTLFGIGAQEERFGHGWKKVVKADDFKVKAVAVEAVPLPAPVALLGGALLVLAAGGAAKSRRPVSQRRG